MPRLTKNHIPNIVGDHAPTLLAFLHLHHVHQRQILHILAERRHQWRIPDAGPYVSHLVEQLNQQLILRHERQVVLHLILIDGLQVFLQVGHQTPHHTSRKPRTNQQRVHQAVTRTDIQAQEIVHELLDHRAYLHVSLHINLRNLEARILQHRLHGQQVGMPGSPRQRLHTHVDVIATGLANLQDRGYAEARSRVAMVLDRDFRIFLLDIRHDTSQGIRTADTRHILDTNLIRAQLNQPIRHLRIIIHRMNR